jgi:hypothetical protein
MTDLGFLPQALVLHRSLCQTGADFRLRVLCMDEPARRTMEPLPGVETVPLAELEAADPALASTRAERTWREYCWTATPAFVLDTLERHPATGPLTWVDADLMFFREPGSMTGELDGGSILLTPHRYYRVYPSAAPAEFLHEHYGCFNGGTISFRADEQGLAAARLWRERTLEWCHFRTEQGRFGNQRYLQDWPERFPGVRVLQSPGAGLAPWNAPRYRIEAGPGGPVAEGEPVLFYHYQSLRLHRLGPGVGRWSLPPNWFQLPAPANQLAARTAVHNRIPRAERRLLWRPYLARLADAVRTVEETHGEFVERLPVARLGDTAADARRKVELNSSRLNPRLRRAARRENTVRPAYPRQPSVQADSLRG